MNLFFCRETYSLKSCWHILYTLTMCWYNIYPHNNLCTCLHSNVANNKNQMASWRRLPFTAIPSIQGFYAAWKSMEFNFKCSGLHKYRKKNRPKPSIWLDFVWSVCINVTGIVRILDAICIFYLLLKCTELSYHMTWMEWRNAHKC